MFPGLNNTTLFTTKCFRNGTVLRNSDGFRTYSGTRGLCHRKTYLIQDRKYVPVLSDSLNLKLPRDKSETLWAGNIESVNELGER